MSWNIGYSLESTVPKIGLGGGEDKVTGFNGCSGCYSFRDFFFFLEGCGDGEGIAAPSLLKLLAERGGLCSVLLSSARSQTETVLFVLTV